MCNNINNIDKCEQNLSFAEQDQRQSVGQSKFITGFVYWRGYTLFGGERFVWQIIPTVTFFSKANMISK